MPDHDKDSPELQLPAEFIKRFGKSGRHRLRMRNAAVRAEVPGGNEFLDALELLNAHRLTLEDYARRVGDVPDGVFAKLSAAIEKFAAARDAMGEGVVERYRAEPVAFLVGDELFATRAQVDGYLEAETRKGHIHLVMPLFSRPNA